MACRQVRNLLALALASSAAASSEFLGGSSSGTEATAQQLASEGGPSEPEPLEHPGNVAGDCYKPCGGSGYCDAFCGRGNACCHRQGGSSAPEECKGIEQYWSWGYECVAPRTHVIVDDEAQLGAGPAEEGELAAEPSHGQADGFILLGAGSLIVVAMMAKYHLASEDALQVRLEDSDSDSYELTLTEENSLSRPARLPLPEYAAATARGMQPVAASFQREPVAPTLLSSISPDKLQLSAAPNK